MQRESNMIELNVDLGILVGLLLTDGSVTRSGSHKTIKFTNKSEKLHQIFKEKLTQIFGINEFQEWEDKRWDNVKTTFIRSSEIFEKLNRIVTTFRTKPFGDSTLPSSRLPEFILSLKEKEICDILRTIFTTDGCVCLGVTWSKLDEMWQIRRLVKFSCLHPVIKEQVSRLLSKLRIHNKTDKDEIVIWRNEDIIKFKEKIGFINGVSVTRDSKNWEGFEKNQILDLVIKSMKLKKKDLQQFKTKEEVINFLKSFLVSVDN